VTGGAGRIYRAKPGVTYNEVPDGYVIYDEVNEKVLFLNLTAAAVLELCDGVNDCASIAAALKDAFDLDAPPESEVAACLESFLAEGLVTDCSPSSTAD
jgi:hypothetical protein